MCVMMIAMRITRRQRINILLWVGKVLLANEWIIIIIRREAGVGDVFDDGMRGVLYYIQM